MQRKVAEPDTLAAEHDTPAGVVHRPYCTDRWVAAQAAVAVAHSQLHFVNTAARGKWAALDRLALAAVAAHKLVVVVGRRVLAVVPEEPHIPIHLVDIVGWDSASVAPARAWKPE